LVYKPRKQDDLTLLVTNHNPGNAWFRLWAGDNGDVYFENLETGKREPLESPMLFCAMSSIRDDHHTFKVNLSIDLVAYSRIVKARQFAQGLRNEFRAPGAPGDTSILDDLLS